MIPSPRIVIVGGVAGGASAAARARRLSESASIVLFERGPHVSFANCGLPYHIGGVIKERARLLVQTPESLRARFGIDVRVQHEVVAIEPGSKEVRVRDLRSGREFWESYDALILSPGAEAIRPGLPGIGSRRVFTLRNLEDMDAILSGLDGARRALVVGAGYVGLELAEQFRHRGLEVALVERLPHVMGLADPEMAFPLQEELVRKGVELHLGSSVAAFEEGERLTAILEQGTGIVCDLAVMCVGVRPETRLAREASLALGATGGIRVDDQMRTSHPDIYAVGDAVEIRDWVSGDPALIPLAGPANRQGRVAADVICGRESRYRGTQGTAVCKVFDLTFATTGLSEAALQKKGLPFRCIYVHPADHATYYPGARPITLKLLFHPDDGRILGAQAVGMAGVDKRIDVIATALHAGLTVYDLENLELCYAPPYGSAKDVVNMAGFVASNVLRKDVALWELEELDSLGDEAMLLDVRTPQEHALGTIPGALCVPVDELRGRLDELPQDKELLLFCQVGLRGYVAARLLGQRGFRVRNLSGGYRTYALWRAFHAKPSPCERSLKRDDGC